MKEKEQIKTFKLKEGNAKNYFKSLHDVLGGEYSDSSFLYHGKHTELKMSSLQIMQGLELIISQAKFGHPLIMEREPDNDSDTIHIYIVYRGNVNQNYNDQLLMLEAGSINSVFIYNGLFPTVTHFPVSSNYNSISLKLSKDVLIQLFPHSSYDLINALINNESIAYHTGLPIQMEALIDDILHYENTKFERIPMLMVKGLELFTQIMLSIKALIQNDKLHGLHQEDYKRLLEIKSYILSKLEDQLVVEDMASEFGVSISKLKRDFKTLYDTSIYQYYTHAKMDEAYRRLKSGKYSVMEVGYDLGYTSIPNFSSMFKKIKGVSPKNIIP
ncbi:AraC family transcriptional regulator [Flammeovirga sp. SJP92]|uniref:helix-turn-helix domain-containing protein n=1 Tax=Flammeovirga sp. SJP92 TaxID=1775430 RepID=UPI000789977D|nr:AraC family transcriptional regulator [Flammeovirga sp. SJP92]KXX70433.1 hypothetical protein AVL50_08730 [Flammeovirga sp. SJP92]